MTAPMKAFVVVARYDDGYYPDQQNVAVRLSQEAADAVKAELDAYLAARSPSSWETTREANDAAWEAWEAGMPYGRHDLLGRYTVGNVTISVEEWETA